MIVYGRNLRSRLPVHHSAFDPIWTKIADAADKKKAELSEKATDHYNSTARDHKPFRVGQHVCVQDTTSKRWDKVGEIVGIGMHCDYRVKMPSGRTWWRNRRYLRLYHSEIEDSLAATPNDDDAHTQDLDQADVSDQPTKKSADGDTRTQPPRRSTRKKTKTVRFNMA